MGETGQNLAMLDFSAGSAEDMSVSVITITDTSSFSGSLSNISLYSNNTSDGINGLLGTISSFDAQTNGVATFNLASNWVIPKNLTKTLTIKADVNAYGSAVSGGAHVINLASNANITTSGAQSGTDITETVTVGTVSHRIYRSRAIVEKGSSSPSGSSVVAANSNVLEFTVAANSAYDAVVNVAAVTMSGSVTATGTGNAFLYKSTDLSTALATEAYKQDLVSIDAGTEPTGQSMAVQGTSGDWDGIPMGATVLINDTSVTTSVRCEVTGLTATILTATCVGTISGYDGTDVGVSYRPMQPGVGKVYFGAQSQLDADLADGAVAVTVESTDGFAIGDTVKVFGYDTLTGAEVSWVSGCVISAISSATALTTSACQLTSDLTIDFDYTQTVANALVKSTNNDAVAWGGAATDGTGVINTAGQVVSAGTTATFVVKGDTTSTGTAGTTATLRADIAAIADLNWDERISFGVTTVTKNLPVTGGTLTYTY